MLKKVQLKYDDDTVARIKRIKFNVPILITDIFQKKKGIVSSLLATPICGWIFLHFKYVIGCLVRKWLYMLPDIIDVHRRHRSLFPFSLSK